MTKTPEKIQIQLKRIEAIKQGIREGKTQVDMALIFGVKKSYIGWLLGKYKHSWKSLKKEIGIQNNIPVNENSSKISSKHNIAKPAKPIGPKNGVIAKNCQKLSKIAKPKVTDIHIDSEQYYLDPSIISDVVLDRNGVGRPDNLSNPHSRTDNNGAPDIDQANYELIQTATEINEDLYKAALLEHVKAASASEQGIKTNTLTELRNYLDKTEKLQAENSELHIDKIRYDELDFDSNKAVIQAIDFIQSETFKKSLVKKHDIEMDQISHD